VPPKKCKMLCEADDAMSIVIIDAIYILSKYASELRAAITTVKSNFSAATLVDNSMRDQDERFSTGRSFSQMRAASILRRVQL
jgi:hypothetical protein